MNLTTLEQSKQLLTWGAPQDSPTFIVRENGDIDFTNKYTFGLPEGSYAAYDLESLIGWVGEGFDELSRLPISGDWQASYRNYGTAYGGTPLEAVYNLAKAIHGGGE